MTLKKFWQVPTIAKQYALCCVYNNVPDDVLPPRTSQRNQLNPKWHNSIFTKENENRKKGGNSSTTEEEILILEE